MSAYTVRIQLLAVSLVGFRNTLAAGWNRIGTSKVGGPVIMSPSTATVTEGQATAIPGVSVSDQFSNALTLTLQDTNGLLTATGTGITGSGTATLQLSGTLAAVNTDLMTLADRETTLVNDVITLNALDNQSLPSGQSSIAVTTVACYLRGTMIATPGGEKAIESLALGDLVLTATGHAEPIRWIGHRAYNTRFARCNPEVLPVRIAAGALDEGVPNRDLYVSARHAMLLDGILVQARDLVNGVTIKEWMPAEQIEYFHIEMAEHAVVLANGAPSESFVDDESRMMFHNAYDYYALYPDAECHPAVYCAPRVSAGPALDVIRRRLAGRIVTEEISRAA